MRSLINLNDPPVTLRSQWQKREG